MHFKLNYDKTVEVKDEGNYFKINNCKPLVEIINVCKDRDFSYASYFLEQTFLVVENRTLLGAIIINTQYFNKLNKCNSDRLKKSFFKEKFFSLFPDNTKETYEHVGHIIPSSIIDRYLKDISFNFDQKKNLCYPQTKWSNNGYKNNSESQQSFEVKVLKKLLEEKENDYSLLYCGILIYNEDNQIPIGINIQCISKSKDFGFNVFIPNIDKNKQVIEI